MPRILARVAVVFSLLAPLGVQGCGSTDRSRYPTTNETLHLSRVVLYRNGVGYFERGGMVEGDRLTIKVRKDQVNDLLKSLTIVERTGGRAVSVSMPLDPQTWANAALSTLGPGRGSLAEVLDALRGTTVTLGTTDGTISGRIVMVEAIDAAPEQPNRTGGPVAPPAPLERDHKVTLLNDSSLKVVRLSKVKTVTLEDGDLAMQLHRSLDATAGEGMFQQVDVAIRLATAKTHDLLVSYVVAAPMWKPTYRVVLPEKGKGKALLQAWAVVDNTSGEDWRDVKLTLTSGAPIAFRYDLHTPRDVDRSDLTETGVRRQARAAVGEATFGGEREEQAQGTATATVTAQAEMDKDGAFEGDFAEKKGADRGPGGGAAGRSAGRPMTKSPRGSAPPAATSAPMRQPVPMAPPPPPPADETAAVDFESLRRSTMANTRASEASGLVRFDLQEKVTVPEGTSTMVAIINEDVEGEETFLYRPGGGGVGYEQNPYRVVRFRNSTPFVLEPGPISIYSGGSFVGEGLSEAVGTKTSATVPFAVDPSILVTSTAKHDGDEMRLIRIVRGVLEVESFARKTTVWTAKLQKKGDAATTILIRHSKAGWNFVLEPRPEGAEDLADGYLVPLKIAAGALEGTLQVIEQTPSRISIGIWDSRALPLLETLLVGTALTPDQRKKLEPIVQKRQAIGKIDTQTEGLRRQQVELDQRASETRQNLEALKRDPAAAAAALRKRLGERLEQFTKDGDRIGREIVELQTKRLELKIELEDALQNLDLTTPTPPKTAPKTAPKTN